MPRSWHQRPPLRTTARVLVCPSGHCSLSSSPVFFYKTLGTQREPENIPGRVHVAVVARATIRTFPCSYSKLCDTFRASDYTAIGTGLGRELLVHFHKYCRFIFQHISESRPSSIQNRFRHSRFCQTFRIDIPNRDERVFASETCR